MRVSGDKMLKNKQQDVENPPSTISNGFVPQLGSKAMSIRNVITIRSRKPASAVVTWPMIMKTTILIFSFTQLHKISNVQ